MSALDLFASAMGAFVLLSVMMLPYYFKGKEYETEIGQLTSQKAAAAAAAAEALAEAATRKLQLTAPEPAAPHLAKLKSLSPAQVALKAALDTQKSLASKADEIEKKIVEEKELAKNLVEPKKKIKKVKVTFRFLGLKSDQDSYLVLIDGSSRVRQFAPNLPDILSGIVSVFRPQKKLAISFYSSVNNQFTQKRWPQSGYLPGDEKNRAAALKFMENTYRTMSGGSATYQALTNAVSRETADAVILVSDGFIFPPHNAGRDPGDVISAVTQANRAGVEINAVAVGLFYKSKQFAEFLNLLSARNKGDFKAIPP